MLFEISAANFISKKQKELNESTILNYIHYINNYLLPRFKGISIDSLTIDDIEKFKNYLINKVSNKTVQNILSVLKQILDEAVKKSFIATNPCRFVAVETIKSDTKKIITNEERERIIGLAKQDLFRGIGIILCVELGLRKGEMLALTWSKINFTKSEIKIDSTVKRCKSKIVDGKSIYFEIGKPKTDKSNRIIPINNQLKILLQKYKEQYKDKFGLKKIQKCFVVVDRKTNKFVLPGNMDYYLKNLLKKCDLNDDITFHTFRHSFITRAIHNGVPVDVVKKVVGHSSIAVTIDIYTHTTQDIVSQYVDKF